MLSRNLEQTLHRALALATERRHEYATLEHLLLALTEDQDAVPVMKACGVDLDQLKQELTSFVDSELQSLRASSPVDPKPTAGFQRVVQRSVIHVQSSGREEVTGANVLVALFSERKSHAVYFLQVQDMNSSGCRELHRPRHQQGTRRAASSAGAGQRRRRRWREGCS